MMNTTCSASRVAMNEFCPRKLLGSRALNVARKLRRCNTWEGLVIFVRAVRDEVLAHDDFKNIGSRAR